MPVRVTGFSDVPLNLIRLVRDDKLLKKDRPRNTTVSLNNLGYTKTGNSDSVRVKFKTGSLVCAHSICALK
jgi:hypothetical protein